MRKLHWKQQTIIEQQKKIIDQLKEKALFDFTYLRTQTYSCGGQTHTVKEYRHKKTGMEFVLIPGDSFMMGAKDIAEPVHKVMLDSFLISKTEVT